MTQCSRFAPSTVTEKAFEDWFNQNSANISVTICPEKPASHRLYGMPCVVTKIRLENGCVIEFTTWSAKAKLEQSLSYQKFKKNFQSSTQDLSINNPYLICVQHGDFNFRIAFYSICHDRMEYGELDECPCFFCRERLEHPRRTVQRRMGMFYLFLTEVASRL